tara:strand:- start:2032 stop:3348 length:1317 start_codon:yes stop_codon:yes gene_type:complete
MAQHDYVIANASGATVRADINNMALAISSNNSASSEPSTKYAYEFWVDTSSNLMKIRNSANNAWITLPYSITASNTVDINGGAIDGTPVGASAASTGAFTTLTTTDNLSIGGSNKELRFYEGANYVGFEAPALSADKIWVLPTADGSANQVLTTNGSGTLSWSTTQGTTINNNADNKVITGSASANTLNAEGDLTWDGSTLSASAMTVGSNITHIGDTNTIIGFDTDTINFTTGGGKRLVVDSSGNVQIGNPDTGAGGSLIVMPTAKLYLDAGGDTYITESSGNVIDTYTGNTRRLRVNSNGLIFGSDTAAANALDDYEEGTYTPSYSVGGGGSVTGVTSTNIATYTKVGRMCTVSITSNYVQTSGTIPTYYYVSLPFTAATTGGLQGFGFGQETGQSGAGMMIQVANSGTVAIIWKYNGGAVPANSYFSIGFQYQTA